MSFHFASTEYAQCFRDLPQPDPTAIRQSAIEYLDRFNPELWYKDPIVSLLNGGKLEGSGEQEVDTVNAVGAVNGRQILASPEQVAKLKDHIRSYKSNQTDLRQPVRQIEQLLFTRHTGYLIGNQCIDFQKQDGITEIEEAIMANLVERRLNDLVLRDESNGKIQVNRAPIYVSAVSNFTNFLDLSRKTLRSLELGIPVIVLGRSQTSQHSYRWTQLLVDLCADAGIDSGMVTFLSCSLNDIIDITSSCQDVTGNLYTTCSRDLAMDIKSTYPKTIASTGGPNTLLCLDWDKDSSNYQALNEAIACSASIESSGQCTALRHCVIPTSVPDVDCQHIFDEVEHLDSATKAVKQGAFSGVFAGHPATPTPPIDSYTKHGKVDAFLTIRDGELPPPGINEFWRKVVVDFSKIDIKTSNEESGKDEVNEQNLDRLAAWLNENQPITLAINGPRQEAISLGLKLWEKTGLVVNTIGSTDDPEMPPALTCQARPQEGEVFGEFPPRSNMEAFSVYPVVVPSSNPSYDATYSKEYLESRGRSISDYVIKSTKQLLDDVKDDAVRGYCVLLIEYLQDVAGINPKQGFGKSRTALWGIQRPPLGMKTVIHCEAETSWDDVAPIYLLFHSTTARDQVELSIDPQNKELIGVSEKAQLEHVTESHDEMSKRISSRKDVFHLVQLMSSKQKMANFPMVGNFVSLYFPLGHIKSTMPNDEEFVLKARMSDKWLNTLF